MKSIVEIYNLCVEPQFGKHFSITEIITCVLYNNIFQVSYHSICLIFHNGALRTLIFMCRI